MSNTTAVSTPQDEVDALMKQTAEEANIELQHDLASKDLASVPDLTPKEKIGEEDDLLAARVRALLPATKIGLPSYNCKVQLIFIPVYLFGNWITYISIASQWASAASHNMHACCAHWKTLEGTIEG